MAEQEAPVRPGHAAEWLLGSQISTVPIQPLGYVIVRNAEGEPVYLCAMVVGPKNIEKMATLLDRLKPHQQPVERLPGEEAYETP